MRGKKSKEKILEKILKGKMIGRETGFNKREV